MALETPCVRWSNLACFPSDGSWSAIYMNGVLKCKIGIPLQLYSSRMNHFILQWLFYCRIDYYSQLVRLRSSSREQRSCFRNVTLHVNHPIFILEFEIEKCQWWGIDWNCNLNTASLLESSLLKVCFLGNVLLQTLVDCSSTDLSGMSIYRLCLLYCGGNLICWYGQLLNDSRFNIEHCCSFGLVPTWERQRFIYTV